MKTLGSTLLWKNTGTSLAPGTIQIQNLKSYRWIRIAFVPTPSSVTRMTNVFSTDNGTSSINFAGVENLNSAWQDTHIMKREFSINGNEITFQTGRFLWNGEVFEMNDRCIPMEIYGEY